MPFGRIEGQGDVPADRLGNGAQARDAAVDGAAQLRTERLQPFHRGMKGAGRLDQRQIGGGGRADRHQRAGILGVQFGAHGFQFLRPQRQRASSQRVDQVGQGEIDGDAGNAGCGERFDRDIDDLDRSGGAVAADQFGAQLHLLALGAQLARLLADHRPGIGQAQRTWRAAQAGGGDATDLRGHVGAEGQSALRHRIDGADQILRAHRLEPLGQRILELRQRRHDPFITMGRDRIEHAARQARGGFGLRRQAIG